MPKSTYTLREKVIIERPVFPLRFGNHNAIVRNFAAKHDDEPQNRNGCFVRGTSSRVSVSHFPGIRSITSRN